MKRQYFEPYGIKINYELKTYKLVGKDYGDSQTASMGLIANLRRRYRKWRNRKQKIYAFCDTYTEWESHVKRILNKNIINSNDLLHWLYYKRNYEQQFLEAVKTVLIPIYIALITLTNFFVEISGREYNILTILSVIILIVLASSKYLYEAMDKVSFHDDFIKIAESEFMSESK